MGRLHDIKGRTEDYLCDNFDRLSSRQICELSEVIKNLSKSIYYCNEVNTNNDKEEHAEVATQRVGNASTYKAMGKDDRVKWLEKYMTELNDDLVKMIKGTSLEEKQIVLNKLNTLIQRVQLMEI